ncbi:hypothetical protein ACFW2X_10450, partial [Streptomyces antibioticus]|uniref:hypothetical protein n=1 Tax=Streptomyces antibioticus TaxID=1890 RepID=UPI00367657A4
HPPAAVVRHAADGRARPASVVPVIGTLSAEPATACPTVTAKALAARGDGEGEHGTPRLGP